MAWHLIVNHLEPTMSKLITPTPGRVVWYWPSQQELDAKSINVFDQGQPLAATVAHVWSDRMVNLSVVDQAGRQFARTSVQLVQDGDDRPSTNDGPFAEWMPYQLGQAVKVAEPPVPPPFQQAARKWIKLISGWSRTTQVARDSVLAGLEGAPEGDGAKTYCQDLEVEPDRFIRLWIFGHAPDVGWQDISDEEYEALKDHAYEVEDRVHRVPTAEEKVTSLLVKRGLSPDEVPPRVVQALALRAGETLPVAVDAVVNGVDPAEPGADKAVEQEVAAPAPAAPAPAASKKSKAKA